MNTISMYFLIAFILFGQACSLLGQEVNGPKILIVTAHPDDEAVMAGTVYKVTHDLNGIADILLVTNGEGGYKYSTLAEEIYGKELTDEQKGRISLPTIRKKELMSGCAYIGMRNFHFMDQKDTEYTLDPDSVLNHVWDTAMVLHRIKELHAKHDYDFVFTLLPTTNTHGHHKAASILALRAVKAMPENNRPIIVGCSVTDTLKKIPDAFQGLSAYPETAITSQFPIDHFNRLTPFGHQQKLNYQIIVNWLIAEHKSQGSMQFFMGKGHLEHFWSFDVNKSSAKESIQAFADVLRKTPFKEFRVSK